MKAITTLFPVFFMIVLGYVCKVKGIISEENKTGIKKLVFNILLPIVIFNALLTSKFEPSRMLLVVYAFAGWVIAYMIGKLCKGYFGEKYALISPYMLMTSEGGSVVLPLYVSIVGTEYIINTVTFDMAGIVIGFVLIPIFVAKQTSRNTDIKELMIKIITNSFVLALLFGLILNLLGFYDFLQNIGMVNVFDNTISIATSSVTPLVLFCLGYEFHMDNYTLKPIIKLIAIRIATSAMIIIGFFVLFPEQMLDVYFQIAVLVYFTSPTGFANALQVQPLFKDKSEESYLSTYTSLYMIITLIAYTLIVSFVA